MRNDCKRMRCGRYIREDEAGSRIANAIIDNKSDRKVIRKDRYGMVCGRLVVYRDAVSFDEDWEDRRMRAPPV